MSERKARRDRAAGVQCSDCGRRSVQGKLVHEPTCPAGRALDDLMVDDRAWFGARPDARNRCRRITTAERVEFADMVGVELSPHSVIHVAQIEPGVRQRALYVPGPEAVPSGTLGFFGHRSTFELFEAANEPLPETRRGVLPSGLEVRMFALPPDMSPELIKTDVHGLVVLLPGDSLPVPFS